MEIAPRQRCRNQNSIFCFADETLNKSVISNNLSSMTWHVDDTFCQCMAMMLKS